MNEPLNPLASLLAARALITDPANWTQEAYARNVRGDSVLPLDPDAKCFCTMGAMYRANGINGTDQHVPGRGFLNKAVRALQLDKPNLVATGPIDLNDHTDHATALEMFDVAIVLAQNGAAA